MGPRYHSTNRSTPGVDFKTALLAGLAPDKGLYTPDDYPAFAPGELASMASLDYPALAEAILAKFIGDQVAADVLARVCKDAYDFPVPVDRVTGDTFVLRLDKGPTASFKDFAARAMARLMAHYTAIDGQELLILTATSGDTGGAVASAFHGVPGIQVVVLFPEREVSERQRRQMTTLGGNVTAVAIEGKFDDCQALVKRAFSDPDLARLNLSSANSINVGRLLPQSVYYTWAYLRVMGATGGIAGVTPVTISVPSGNFGNLMGGLIARECGLPVAKFVASVNENDEFPRFLETGAYAKIEPSRACLSNAMNVGHPSNLARIVDLFGGTLSHDGAIVKVPDMGAMRAAIASASISDEQTRAIIKQVHDDHGYLLEPHGAVGWGGLASYQASTGAVGPAITIETADPAKFPEAITEILGIDPPLPASLAAMQGKPESSTRLRNEYGAFKAFLASRF